MTDPTPPDQLVRPLVRTRQVREFTDQPLDDTQLDALTDVARWSGSAENSQPWRFVTVREPAILHAIAAAGVPQTRSLRTATAAIAIVMPERDQALVDAYDEGRVAERILIGASVLGIAAGIALDPHRRTSGGRGGAGAARRSIGADDRGTGSSDGCRPTPQGGAG